MTRWNRSSGSIRASILGSASMPRTAGLVRLSGLVALQSAPQAYEWGVAAALTAGCSEEEVVAVLAALAPVIGAARVSKAAADIAVSIGCDAAGPG